MFQGAVLKGQECQKNFIPDTKTNPLALREMLTSKHGMVVSILELRFRFKVKFFLFKRFLKNNVKQLVLRACEKLSWFSLSFKVGGKFQNFPLFRCKNIIKYNFIRIFIY